MHDDEIAAVSPPLTLVSAPSVKAYHRLQALDLHSIRSHEWKIVGCSAVSGKNLVEGLNWVVNNVASRLYYSTVRGPGATVSAPVATLAT